MTLGLLILSLILGLAAALGGGALSGFVIGRSALGGQLAAYMGALYGIMAGIGAVVLTLFVLALI